MKMNANELIGKQFFHDWKAESIIGSGSYGTVYRMTSNRLGETTYAAMKWIGIPQQTSDVEKNRSRGATEKQLRTFYTEQKDRLVREIRVMDKFHGHSNIIDMLNFETHERENGMGWDVFILMELLDGLESCLPGMTVQDIRITLGMDSYLEEEFKSFRPDVIYTDSVCFWGKLNAWKHHVPMVVSTSTFAFNQLSSQYMKNTPKEMADMILGLPRVSKELKKLEPYGYHVKGALSLVQSDNQTDSIVYTSRRFQPYAESFSDHYAFVGPSVFSNVVPEKTKERPLVYISLGTVINDRPDFYTKCIEALRDQNIDVIISCGGGFRSDAEVFNTPQNTRLSFCG